MVFPAPHPRETLPSYGYRIARLSGLSGLPELASLFGMDLRALVMGDEIDIRRFAKYAGYDPEVVASGALDASNPHRLQIGRDRRAKVQCNPERFRYCPACLGGLTTGDLRSACLGRTDWLIDAVHVCADHGMRLISIPAHKKGRVHHDLASLLPLFETSVATLARPDTPTVLESYLLERLRGEPVKQWLDVVQMDVVVHTAEIFGAMAMRGPKSDWSGISLEERREHGRIGVEPLLGGPIAIKDFLRQHVGNGRYGNDYHNAFGHAFNEFYSRKVQPVYRPICMVLAEYVGETFRFTGQDKVFGIRMRGVEPRTLRAQCEKHGIGLKITSQILKVQYGQSGLANDEVDPALMEELAVRLKGLLNLRDVQNQLGASVELVKALIEDGLLTPDFRFNDRMVRFVSATVEAFLEEWLGTAKRIVKNRRATLMLITEVARRYRVSVSRLLRAARSRGAKLYRDYRMKGFRGIFLDEADVLGLIKLARSEGGDHLGRKAAVMEQEDFRQLG